MKRTDIAMIILIASVSVIIAYGAVSAIPIFQSSKEAVNVPTIVEYNANVTQPDDKIFNDDAINPTVDVTIGESQ